MFETFYCDGTAVAPLAGERIEICYGKTSQEACGRPPVRARIEIRSARRTLTIANTDRPLVGARIEIAYLIMLSTKTASRSLAGARIEICRFAEALSHLLCISPPTRGSELKCHQDVGRGIELQGRPSRRGAN